MYLLTTRDLTATHADRANLELRRARHYLGTSQVSAIAGHAKVAGEYAAYSGLGLAGFLEHPALDHELIATAFIESLAYTTELLREPPIA